MALETKLAKSVKKHTEKEKAKDSKKKHATVEKHEGGYLVEKHSHGSDGYGCGDGCSSSVHKTMGGAAKDMKSHFEGIDSDEGEMD